MKENPKQKKLLKQVRKRKRFVKKVTRNKQAKEKSFAIRCFYERGVRRINGKLVQSLRYEDIKIAYQTHFNKSLSAAYLEVTRGKSVASIYNVGEKGLTRCISDYKT